MTLKLAVRLLKAHVPGFHVHANVMLFQQNIRKIMCQNEMNQSPVAGLFFHFPLPFFALF